MRYLLIILQFLGVFFSMLGQTFNKPFLLYGYNTIPCTINSYDGKIFVCGYAGDSTGGRPQIKSFFTRFSDNGVATDSSSYRPDSIFHFAMPVLQTKSIIINRGLLVCGYINNNSGNSEASIMLYDTLGNMIFWKSYPHILNPYVFCVAEKSEHRLSLTGVMVQTLASIPEPFYILTDSIGNELNRVNYYGLITGYDYVIPRSIIELDSGNALIVCEASKELSIPNRFKDPYKTILIKVDSVGNELWHWIDPDDNGQTPYSFQKTSDGGYISCGLYMGYRDSLGGKWFQPSIVKWKPDFTKEWQRWFYNQYDSTQTLGIFYDVKELADGSYIVCGDVSSNHYFRGLNGYLLKVDKDGNTLWEHEYRTREYFASNNNHYLYDLDVFSNGDIIAVGEINPTSLSEVAQQGWLLRVDSNGCVVDSNWCGYDNIEIEPTYSVATNHILEIYPNPSSEIINLKMNEFGNLKISDAKIEIYDAMGRSILQQKIATSQEQPIGFRNDSQGNDLLLQINIADFNTGLFFVRLLDKSNVEIGNGKFVKE